MDRNEISFSNHGEPAKPGSVINGPKDLVSSSEVLTLYDDPSHATSSNSEGLRSSGLGKIDFSHHGEPRSKSSNGINHEDDLLSMEAETKLETNQTLVELKSNSEIFKDEALQVAEFRHEELCLGKVIGMGEFGEVLDILEIKDAFNTFGEWKPAKSLNFLDDSTQRVLNLFKEGKRSSLDASIRVEACLGDIRTHMSERCLRGNIPRYAVKRVREGLCMDMKQMAIVDLAVEARFLACLSHSNIVRLRATAGIPGSSDYFLVLDRLISVLDKRVKEWAAEVARLRGPLKLPIFGRAACYNLLTDRMVAMFDIARALKHLHGKRVLFRDLKPENIGCDVRGDFKIFDFGLARELKQKNLIEPPDGFQLTGMTGSRRWMAPENCMHKNYGLSADVYSFSLLFWHVISLSTPFDGYGRNKHLQKVILQGERPNPRKMKVNSLLRSVIVEGWSSDPQERPTMERLCRLIQVELLERKNNAQKSGRFLDRSRHLIDQSMMSHLGSD